MRGIRTVPGSVSGTADSLKVLDLVITVPDLWGNVFMSSAIVNEVV